MGWHCREIRSTTFHALASRSLQSCLGAKSTLTQVNMLLAKATTVTLHVRFVVSNTRATEAPNVSLARLSGRSEQGHIHCASRLKVCNTSSKSRDIVPSSKECYIPSSELCGSCGVVKTRNSLFHGFTHPPSLWHLIHWVLI
jgi:hypothetical protein